MPKFTSKSGGGPSLMKKYGQGRNPIMMKSPMKKDWKDKLKAAWYAIQARGGGRFGEETITKRYKRKRKEQKESKMKALTRS